MKRAAVVFVVMLAACDKPHPDAYNLEQSMGVRRDLPFVSQATWANVGTLECRPSSMDFCATSGCDRREPKIWMRWTPGTNQYQRCGPQGCDSYSAQVTYPGAFANLALPEHVMFASLTADNTYVEVLTLMDGIYVYRGKCTPLNWVTAK